MKLEKNFTSDKEIIVIDPSLKSPEVASFNRLQKVTQIPLTYHLPSFQLEKDYLQTPVDRISGLIIFGSAASVNEKWPWQRRLVEWMEKVILPNQIPVFGICYGHQLLHQVFGGRVDYVRPDKQKLAGTRMVRLKGTAGLPLNSLAGEIVFSHCEHVLESGQGFENWAENEAIAHEASFHREYPIWTMQTHPEATQTFYDQLSLEYLEFKSTFGWSVIDSFLMKIQSE